jgi:hypothetical protein
MYFWYLFPANPLLDGLSVEEFRKVLPPSDQIASQEDE